MSPKNADRPPSYTPPTPSNPFHGFANGRRSTFEPLPAYTDLSAPLNERTGFRRRRPQAILSHSRCSMASCTEHVITLRGVPAEKKERSWAQLRIHSFAPLEGETPLFHPGDEVVGCVELDLKKEKCIGGIQISLRGYSSFTSELEAKTLVTSPGYVGPPSNAPAPFLNLETVLWKPSMGDPRSIATPPSASSAEFVPVQEPRKLLGIAKRYKEKVLGPFSFPFNFTLPYELDGEFLPPNVCEVRGKTPIHIKYELEVNIQTAITKVDAMILCPIRVVPRSLAPHPSPARELVYTCHPDDPEVQMYPPGPEQDPTGWTSMRPFRLNKTSCVMSLANPLVYVRGTPIDIHLQFTDGFAIDPSDLRIVLVNSVSLTNDANSYSSNGVRCRSVVWASRFGIANAVCYRRPQDGAYNIIHGEIKVPKDLIPDFQFKGAQSEYHVLLYPSSAPSSSITPGTIINSSSAPVLSASVTIATVLPVRDESPIRPVSFLPPHLASLSDGSSHRTSGEGECSTRPHLRAGRKTSLDAHPEENGPMERLLGVSPGSGWGAYPFC